MTAATTDTARTPRSAATRGARGRAASVPAIQRDGLLHLAWDQAETVRCGIRLPGQTNTAASQAEIVAALVRLLDDDLAVHYRANAAFGRHRVLERAR